MSRVSGNQFELMMVEDDRDLCEGWREVFELLGHRVHCFMTATEALQSAAVIRSCDLLITDYYLPDMNGGDLARKAREIHANLPVVFLTGSRESGITASLREFANSIIVHKPVSIDELQEKIVELLARS